MRLLYRRATSPRLVRAVGLRWFDDPGTRAASATQGRSDGEYIVLDAHSTYGFASVENREDGRIAEARVDHRPGAITDFLSSRRHGPAAFSAAGAHS